MSPAGRHGTGKPVHPGTVAVVSRAPQLVALAVALATAGLVIWLNPPNPPAQDRVQSDDRPPAALTQTWPQARVVTSPGSVKDGRPYSPWLHLDAETSIGSAATPDGSATRLLVRSTDGTERELRRIPKERFPQFLGFTTAGPDVYWAESTASVAADAETRLWKANWRTGKATSLTNETGGAVFFNSQYDLVVADGRLHWVAAAPGDTLVTELRSLPVDGGKVTIRQIPGAYGLSAWPWLVSAPSDGPLELFNLGTDARVRVPTSATELVGCSPTWCRAMVVGQSGGAARFDLMRPDGSDRHRIAGSSTSASVSDVALLDRFEVLSRGRDGAVATSQLLLYDSATRKTTLVAEGVGIVIARGGVLWWSTGTEEAGEWHALDLRTLT